MVQARRGVTLPELMVGMTLTGLVLSLVYPVISRTMRALVRADADTQSQQQAVLCIEKFFADFASTSRASLCVVESLPAASFLSQQAPLQPGLPALRPNDDYYPSDANTSPTVWLKFVAMAYNASDKTLERIDLPYSDGNYLACMRANQLTALLADVRYRDHRRTVVRGIDSLRMRANGDASLALDMISAKEFDEKRTTRIQVTLTMRN